MLTVGGPDMPAPKPASRRRAPAAPTNFEGFASFSNAVAQLLQGTSGTITSLIESILQAEDEVEVPQGKGKGKSKRMSDSDLAAHASLLSQALEELRYEVENNRKDAIAQAEDLRQYLLEAGQRPGINPNTFLFVLQQFAVAKLDIGSELRGLAEQVLGNLAASAPADDAASIQEIAKGLKEVASALDGNPFAIHAEVSEFAQTLPPDLRAMLAASLLTQKDVPALRDAALGWLLDDAAEVRRTVAQMLEKDAASNGGAMLRRMIALRNWVPEADRPALDRAIKASQKKVACASWSSAKVLEAYASGCDGSGAQSVFMIVAQGRKRAFAALLFKQDAGIRDAWVRGGGTQAEVRATLEALGMQMDLLPVPLEYAASAVRHFLGINAQSGVLPPFGLLDVAEVTGLASVNPEFQPVDALLASLCDEIPPKRATPQAIAKALKASASWGETHPIAASWFEESDEADAILAQGKLSKAKRKAALLAMPMQKRRRWWATLIAWTGFTLKHAQEGGGWEDYVLVAREMLGNRPLDEFGIMNEIAEATIANYSGGW
jgi:hypothetical protein